MLPVPEEEVKTEKKLRQCFSSIDLHEKIKIS